MSELKKLTRLGSDTKKIAALLQAKAPKGHKLAYINDEEAALLKARGGSGKPHADTGIPSYQEEGVDIGFGPGEYTPQDSFNVAPSPSNEQIMSDIGYTPEFGGGIAAQPGAGLSLAAPASSVGLKPAGGLGVQAAPSAIETPALAAQPSPAYDVTSRFAGAGAAAAAPEKEEGVADQLAKASGLSKETLGRLGLAGALGLMGSRTAAKAGEVGQKGAQQIQALASPYQLTGQQLQAQAQRGELTPAGQQSLQAMQARLAQGAEARGGVGAQQAQAQVEALRQQLLQQQYDYGLKLSGIGDNIALGAIKTGMQADQYVNHLTNQFYSNMAYIASGMSPGVRVGGAG